MTDASVFHIVLTKSGSNLFDIPFFFENKLVQDQHPAERIFHLVFQNAPLAKQNLALPGQRCRASVAGLALSGQCSQPALYSRGCCHQSHIFRPGHRMAGESSISFIYKQAPVSDILYTILKCACLHTAVFTGSGSGAQCSRRSVSPRFFCSSGAVSW